MKPFAKNKAEIPSWAAFKRTGVSESGIKAADNTERTNDSCFDFVESSYVIYARPVDTLFIEPAVDKIDTQACVAYKLNTT